MRDVRKLTKDYDGVIPGNLKAHYEQHLYDPAEHVSHSVIVDFSQAATMYDRVILNR